MTNPLKAASALVVTGLTASPAVATMCDTNFEQRGTYPERRHYVSHVDIPGTTPAIAFGQLKTIFAETGIRVLSEDRAVGQIIAEMPARTLIPAQPVTVHYTEAEQVGRVELVWTVKEELIMSRRSMQRDICAVLGRLTDADGRVPTEPQPRLAFSPAVITAVPVVQGPAFIDIEASDLARQVSLARDNPARINASFGGKTYRVSGVVRRVAETYAGYDVQFDGIAIPTADSDYIRETRMQIVCHVPKAKIAAAAAVYPDQRGTLTGKFERLENHSLLPQISLGDCGN